MLKLFLNFSDILGRDVIPLATHKMNGENPKSGIAKISKIELNIDFYGEKM